MVFINYITRDMVRNNTDMDRQEPKTQKQTVNIGNLISYNFTRVRPKVDSLDWFHRTPYN